MLSVGNQTNEGPLQTKENRDLVRIGSGQIIVSFHTPLKGDVKQKLVLKILLNYWRYQEDQLLAREQLSCQNGGTLQRLI